MRQRKPSKVAALDDNGKLEVHLPFFNDNYATLCGLDGNADSTDITMRPTETTHLLTCPDCLAIWLLCRRFSARDIS